jgi:hypothetical protein
MNDKELQTLYFQCIYLSVYLSLYGLFNNAVRIYHT